MSVTESTSDSLNKLEVVIVFSIFLYMYTLVFHFIYHMNNQSVTVVMQKYNKFASCQHWK